MMYAYNFGQGFGAGAPSLNLRLDLMSDDVINTQPASLREYTYLGAHNERGDDVITSGLGTSTIPSSSTRISLSEASRKP